MGIESAADISAPLESQDILLPIYGRAKTKFVAWRAIQATGALKELPYLSFEKNLGGGASFAVGQYRDLNTPGNPTLVAVKTAKVSGSSDRDLDPILREIQILHFKPLKEHRNIVTVLGMDWALGPNGAPTPRLVVEFAQHGTLTDFLRASSLGLPARAFIRICLDIASGLDVVHRCGLIHGDLKLANLLVFKDDSGRLVVKISDFGAALSVSEPGGKQKYRGTIAYQAPELTDDSATLSPQDHRQCDMYSYGLCVWEILKRGHPYFDDLSRNGQRQRPTNNLVEAVRVVNAFKRFLYQLGVTQSSILVPDPISVDNTNDDLTRHEIAEAAKIQLTAMYDDLVTRCLSGIPWERYDTTSVVNILQEWETPETVIKAEKNEEDGQFVPKYLAVMSPLPTTRPVLFQAQSAAFRELKESLGSLDRANKSLVLSHLSFCYAHGQGVAVDFAESFRYLELASDAGNVFCQAVRARVSAAVIGQKHEHQNTTPNMADAALRRAMSGECLRHQVDAGVFEALETQLVRTGQDNLSARIRHWMMISEAEVISCGFVVEAPGRGKIWILPGNFSGVMAAVDIGAFSLDDSENFYVHVNTTMAQFRVPWLHFIAGRGWRDVIDCAIQRNSGLLGHEITEKRLYGMLHSRYLDANTPQETDCGNLLFSATLNGRVELVKYLLASGMSAKSGDLRRAHFLHNLFKFEDETIPEIANLLVASGADVNARVGGRSIFGETLLGSLFIDSSGPPLMTNTWAGNETAVRTLLQLGADPLLRKFESEDSSSWPNSLELAVSLHLYNITDMMLENIIARGLGACREVKSVICHLAQRGDILHRWLLHGSNYVIACRKTIDVCLQHGCSFSEESEQGSIPVSQTVAMNPCLRYSLKALLDAGANPNATDTLGRTALMYAARPTWSKEDNATTTRILLSRGASTNCATNDGCTAMHLHAKNNSNLSLEVILDSGADMEAKDEEGETPLCCAAYSPLGTDALRLLLDRGADMKHFAGPNKLTPLGFAVSSGNIPGMRVLLDRDASVQPPLSQSILYTAILAFRVNSLRILLGEYGHLFSTGHLDGTQCLEDEWIPLQLATNSPECIKLLLDAGADINARNAHSKSWKRITALSQAASHGRLESAALLLTRGATPFCRGDPPLPDWSFIHDLAACPPQSHTATELLQFLRRTRRHIRAHGLLNLRSGAYGTPLESAVYHGHAALVQALVEFGASVGGCVELTPLPTMSHGLGMRFLRRLVGVANGLSNVDLLSYAKMLRGLTPRQLGQIAGRRDASVEEMDDVVTYLRSLPFFVERERLDLEGGMARQWQLDRIARQTFGEP